MFVAAADRIPDLDQRLPSLAAAGLSGRLTKEDRALLLWMLGLTEKAMQNVLRDDRSAVEAYAGRYKTAVDEAVAQVERDHGPLTGELGIAGSRSRLTWALALYITSMIGAQTLAIRGSEKSMYGKLFERLVLGSVLHVLGLRMIDQSELTTEHENVFWLTSAREKRESDATALITAGRGVRFDIGFIGRGNPEITLDKVSRFEREVEFGRYSWYLRTFILVDTIPKGSRLPQLAAEIDGTIVQMSSGYWPKVLATELWRTVGYESELASEGITDVPGYVGMQLATAPINQMIATAAADTEDAAIAGEVRTDDQEVEEAEG